MIRFDNVTKVYDRKSKPALDAVSLEIDRGEFAFLVGSSGSGKSTFLKLVLKEDRATRGAIYVAGQNVANVSSWRVPKFRRGIGVVFQDFRLLPNKTVFANVAFAMQVLGKPRSVIRQTVPEVLKTVGLDGKENRMPHELSGGEQQRVAIARAIVNKPGILLADEPTGNLDPTTSMGIMSILDKINQNGTTVVMATHDDDIVNSMRKRVIELSEGVIIRDEARAQYTSMIPVITPAMAEAAKTASDGAPRTRSEARDADARKAEEAIAESDRTATAAPSDEVSEAPAAVVPAAADAATDVPAEAAPASPADTPAWKAEAAQIEAEQAGHAKQAEDLMEGDRR